MFLPLMNEMDQNSQKNLAVARIKAKNIWHAKG